MSVGANNQYGIASDKPKKADIVEDPFFVFQQEQNAYRQQQQNQQQQAYNQIAQQNAQANTAGLQLDQAQLQLQHQQNISRLLQDLLGAQFQTMMTGQTGARNLSDLATRLLDTRFNVERQSLQDQLRIAQMENDLNRIIDSPASRARRLIGG